MKITAIKTTVVNAGMRNWIFVKVETDQVGLHGWGEATLEWKTRAVVGAVEDLAPLLVGHDPRDIEQAVRIMHKHGFWRMGVIGTTAISGIEVALWMFAAGASALSMETFELTYLLFLLGAQVWAISNATVLRPVWMSRDPRAAPAAAP